MLSRGTVHSIGGKEIGCCWSDPSCSIAAVPGPALTLTLSRGQPTVTERPHCESFNRLTVASLKITETQVPGSTVAVAETVVDETAKRRNVLHLCLKLLPLLQVFTGPVQLIFAYKAQYKVFSTAVLAWPYSTTVLASGKWPEQAEVRNGRKRRETPTKRRKRRETPTKRRNEFETTKRRFRENAVAPLQPLQATVQAQAFANQALYRPSISKPLKQYRTVQA